MHTRREAIKIIGWASMGTMVNTSFPGLFANKTLLKRTIPSTGEMLPVVGLGTWQTFDVGPSESERQPLREVLKLMKAHGAKVIDSSPMYGRSEEVVGDLANELGNWVSIPSGQESFFYATKVWTRGKQEGIRQMQASLRKFRRGTMDLMQIHNLVDWKTHLKTLREWKAQGKIRYLGITHYAASAHDQLEQIIKSKDIDFVQVNFSILDRNAERSLLNTAREQKVAVLINRPYGGGDLFRMTRGKEIPTWAAEYGIESWGQFFLKYILSHPVVTCVIPGTSKPHHMLDNLKAGYGNLPDQKTREKMIAFVEGL